MLWRARSAHAEAWCALVFGEEYLEGRKKTGGHQVAGWVEVSPGRMAWSGEADQLLHKQGQCFAVCARLGESREQWKLAATTANLP